MAKNKNRAKKIVVTGAAGFIGYHVSLALLERGWKVVGIDNIGDYYDPRMKYKRLAMLKKHPQFVFRKVNIAKFEALQKMLKEEKPDEVLHLAAQPGVRYSLTNPWTYIESNEIGTLNVFECAHRLKLPRVVYASSSSVYGANEKSPMSEDDRADRQIAVYGVTKKANEALAHAYNHLYGIEMIGLRFFTVYGTWYRPDLALYKFVKNILTGKPIDVYNRGDMKRSFTHISDVVDGVLAVLKQKPHGRNEIYNLGGAEAVPLLEFIKAIEDASGKTAKKRMLPMQAGDVHETFADWSKANRELGFVPRKDMREGIAEFVAWFRENETFLLSLGESKQ
ncbi:MAG: NAD-dependent epimerase/dehydratase family protein [Minisyncoccia bacterium]